MINNIKQLATLLRLDLKHLNHGAYVPYFPLKVPKSFAQRIKSSNINDPLLLQILPTQRELQNVRGFSLDPLYEQNYSQVPGLIHKYYGRVLLLATANCALNCRFCFRRHLRTQVTDWQKVFAYIKNDTTIQEVILSGGDPLMLKSQQLKTIFTQLALIPHVTTVRIHSRLPIVMPERITCNLLPSTNLPLILIVHCNHPQEINPAVIKAINTLRRRNIMLLNQTVLLHEINNDSATLIALSKKLGSIGILPIYLHLLDKVQGAAHFNVPLSQARRIHKGLQKKLPGYLVPKLIRDGKNKKTCIL